MKRHIKYLLEYVLVPMLCMGTVRFQRSMSARETESANESPFPRRTVGTRIKYLMVFILLSMAASAGFGQTADPLADKSALWKPTPAEEVGSKTLACLDAAGADAAVRAKAERIWRGLSASPSEDDLLVRLAATYALIDPRAAKLVEQCSRPRGRFVLPSQDWLRDPAAPPLLADNLRLFYARWLVDESLYDEALEQISDLKPAAVVAPAALLFYQSVVYHSLLNKESGLKSIGTLLAGERSSPRRYVVLARLMREDLSDLKEDTLDHIARRMEDVRRRLDLGRGGKNVRKRQDGIIESLDKLIKKLEEQQQQMMQANILQPGTPMQDSKIAGGRGPGEVDKKNIGSESGWGNLPPKEREKAMQQIGRDFPSHYRHAIEQYFRRLAAEENK